VGLNENRPDDTRQYHPQPSGLNPGETRMQKIIKLTVVIVIAVATAIGGCLPP
jgi:hypothetical protein